MDKLQVYVFYSTYGSHKHDVLVIQVGGEAYNTVANSHYMLDPHDKEFGRNLFEHLTPYLNEKFNVSFIQSPGK